MKYTNFNLGGRRPGRQGRGEGGEKVSQGEAPGHTGIQGEGEGEGDGEEVTQREAPGHTGIQGD